MERAAAPRAGQESLRLGRAGKESPQNVFDRTGNPLALGQAQQLPRFGIGKDNFARALKKNQNRQSVENFVLRVGIGVSVQGQFHGLPRNRRRWRWRGFPYPPGSGLWYSGCH